MQKAIVVFASVWPAVAFLITMTTLAACTPNLLVAHEEEEKETCRYQISRTQKITTCDTTPSHWELGP